MKGMKSVVLRTLGIAGMLVLASGCTIKATTDTTTDGTTEFLSSTSGHAWWTDNGLVREGYQAQAFVGSNCANLLSDMAKGDGEYLRAFGSIVGVKPSDQAQFALVVQANFSELHQDDVDRDEHTMNEFLSRVQQLTGSLTDGPRIRTSS